MNIILLRIIIFIIFLLIGLGVGGLVGNKVGNHKKIEISVVEECKDGICPEREDWEGGD